MSYGLELRKLVIDYIKKGGRKKDAAETFQVSSWCITQWWKRRDDLKPKTSPGRPPQVDLAELRKRVKSNPSETLQSHADFFNVSDTAILNALRKLGYTYKKKSKIYGA